MKILRKSCGTVFVAVFILLASARGEALEFFKLPPLPLPEQYGNILISRNSEFHGVEPVTFSHWRHRTKYTCRVCHLELDFGFETNSTEITEEANRKGKFCGACHDGKTAFGHTKENCDKCHNGNADYGSEKFSELSNLPKARYGNRINWAAALEKGMIKPKSTILGNYQPMPFDRRLSLSTAMYGIPPSVFPHKSHAEWLDCANCHPDIFNTKKNTTKDFSMERILKKEFCGVCHLSTAFPLDDCKRCHVWK